jgi:hypothetical protein
MNLWNETKSVPVSKQQVWDAYKKVLSNDGSAGIDCIPTISDCVAQMVVKNYQEERFEKIFSPHSYGYRPDKNAHQALVSVRMN